MVICISPLYIALMSRHVLGMSAYEHIIICDCWGDAWRGAGVKGQKAGQNRHAAIGRGIWSGAAGVGISDRALWQGRAFKDQWPGWFKMALGTGQISN